MRFHLPALFLGASLALSAQSSVPALDPAGLRQALKSGQWTIIEFGGPTCVPCKRMQPILGELQARFGDRAQIKNLYITEHPKEAQAHRVMVMPTQVIFDPKGREVSRHMGFWPREEFLAALAQAGLK